VASDTARQVTDLTSRYLDDTFQLWRQYADGLRRMSEGVFTLPAAGRPAAGTPDLTARARDFVRLSATHYSKLLTSYADFTAQVFATVLPAGTSQGSPAERPPAAAAPHAAPDAPLAHVELRFAGKSGEVASQSFVVANKKAGEVDVGFELTEFVSEDGARRFRAPVAFTPDRFVLAPGAEQVVACGVTIDPAFVPGTRYMALVRIVGFPEIRTALLVVPEPAPARGGTDAPARPAVRSARSSAKPRRKS
jgi:hypothetical protein